MNKKDFERKLTEYNESYRKGEPLISDKEYDTLIETYKKEYGDEKFLSTLLGPTSQVKVRLPYRMTSLDKVKSIDEIKKWAEGFGEEIGLLVTPKYDGISLLVDIDGVWTKGNCEWGVKVTNHFSKVNFPYQITQPLIGEAIMKTSVFKKKYCKSIGGEYSHPRNMVAGLFNQVYPSEKLRDVDFICYGIPRSIKYSYSDRSWFLDFYNVPNMPLTIDKVTTKKLDDIYYYWKNCFDYKIDGLVIEPYLTKYQDRVRDMASGNIGWSVAYKNPQWAETYESVVTGICIEVSKQGKLKPVIEIKPINVDGVVVTRVTGNNMKFITDLRIKQGVDIGIKRSGEVIPKITTIHSLPVPQRDELTNKEWQEKYQSLCEQLKNIEPHVELICPSCGSMVEWDDNKVELICNNSRCNDKILAKLVYFFETLGIRDFGKERIKSIMNYYEMYNPLNYFCLTLNSLCKVPGWGEESSMKVLRQFDEIKQNGIPYARLLTALDVFEGKIGEATCQTIIDESSNYWDINEILRVRGVDQITAVTFLSGLITYTSMTTPNPVPISYIKTPEPKYVSNKLEGQTFVFTGVKDRECEEWIKSHGGSIGNGVNSKTTTLVAKSLDSGSNKTQKAREIGVNIISYDELLKKIKE